MQLKHTIGMKQQGETNIGCKPCSPQLLPDRQAITSSTTVRSSSVRHEKHLEHCCMLSIKREHGTSPADIDSANDCSVHAAGMMQQCIPKISCAISKQVTLMGGMQNNWVGTGFEPMQQAGHCQGEKRLQHLCVGRTVQSSLDTKVEHVTTTNAFREHLGIHPRGYECNLFAICLSLAYRGDVDHKPGCLHSP